MSEIRNRITLDSTQFNQQLRGVQGGVQGLAKSIGSLPVIGSALSVTALVAAARSLLRTADEIDNLATQTGLGVEAVQAYQRAMDEAGLSMGALQSASDRLRRQQAEAISGNDSARRSFQALGISMDDLRTADTTRLLEMVGQGMHQTEGDANATAASFNLLGRNSERLKQVLIDMNKDGIQAQIESFRELGMIVDEEYIQTLNNAELQLDRFGQKTRSWAARETANWINVAGDFKEAFAAFHPDHEFRTRDVRLEEDVFGPARQAREEQARRELEGRIAGEESAAGEALQELEEKRRVQALTNEELRRELNLKLELAQTEMNLAETNVERLEALRKIHDAEERLARIRDERVREEAPERRGRDDMGALRRIGAHGQWTGGQQQNETTNIMRRQLAAQELQSRILSQIEQSLGMGGATF